MDGQVIWITGLSGAGKTTVAAALDECLRERGLIPILLDGDILRNLFKSTDEIGKTYNREARIKLALKYAHLCKTLSSQGFIVKPMLGIEQTCLIILRSTSKYL